MARLFIVPDGVALPYMGPAMLRRRALPGTKIDAPRTPKSQTLRV